MHYQLSNDSVVYLWNTHSINLSSAILFVLHSIYYIILYLKLERVAYVLAWDEKNFIPIIIPMQWWYYTQFFQLFLVQTKENWRPHWNFSNWLGYLGLGSTWVALLTEILKTRLMLPEEAAVKCSFFQIFKLKAWINIMKNQNIKKHVNLYLYLHDHSQSRSCQSCWRPSVFVSGGKVPPGSPPHPPLGFLPSINNF